MKMYNIFHRVTSLLCALALLLGMCAVPVAAADTLRVTAATGTPIKQGSTGDCSVSIDSTESLASLSVTVHFDPAKVKITDLYNSIDCMLYDSSLNGDNLQFSYILDGEGEAAKTQLFSFRYEVLSDAEIGAAFFDITVSEAYDSALNAVPVSGSRCYFNIAEGQTVKRCTARVDKTEVSTLVEEEFSLSYSFSTNQIASGSAAITYDPELFEVVEVVNGAFLDNKVADVNTDMAGSIYLSFVGTAYADARDVLTVTFKTVKNVTDTSSISFKVSELYDKDLNPITCPSISSTVQIAYDPNYTGDAPTMRLTAAYDSTTEQVTAVINLEELSKLGAGDFVVEFDPAVLTLVNWKKGFNPTFFTVNDKEAAKGLVKFSIVSLKDIVAAATVLTLTFDVTYACTDQEAVIALSGSMLSDSLTNPIVLNVRGGKTTVPLRHYIGDWVIDPTPTCTETGLNVRKCTVCGIVLETGEEIPANGHTPVVDAAVAQDCVNTGLTEGSHCDVCGVVFVAQEIIPANGHTEAIDAAVAKTCTTTGLTEGKHCSVCNEILVAQEVIPASHDLDENHLCTSCGLYSGNCGEKAVWELDTASGVLTISGSGAMYDYTSAPWYGVASSVRSVIVEEGITKIGRYAFSGCANLTQVQLPDTVTTIESYAFSYCTSLETIRLPVNLTGINGYTFVECTSLQELEIPESVTGISSYAFSGCTALTAVRIPESVSFIGSGAFYNCSSLTEVNLPEGLISLNDHLFFGCSSLTTVEIPETVTSIGAWIFDECSSLETIVIPESVSYIGYGAFYNCSSLTAVTLPSCLKSIESNTFSYCTSLREIVLPEGLTAIGASAFQGCSALEEIRIPAGVTEIGEYAFSGCSSLTEVHIPAGMTAPGNYVFQNCSSLRRVVLPENMEYIPQSMFENCSALEEISIPESVTEIRDYAFQNCTALTAVEIPENVTLLGRYAFANCSRLQQIRFTGNAPAIGYRAFRYDNATAYYPYPDDTWTADVMQSYGGTIKWQPYCTGEHTPVTDEAVAQDCVNTGLTEGSHCEICGEVFVAQEIIPANGHTEVIDEAVAHTCRETGLTEGKHCSVCHEVLIAQQIVPDAHDLDENGLCRVCGKYAGTCGSFAKWELDAEGTLSIYGSGSMTDYYNNTSMPWYAHKEIVRKVVVEEGITGIGRSAFEGHSNLTEVMLPDSLRSIGYSAFRDCTGLVRVDVPDGVTSLGGSAFYGCTNLQRVHVPENLSSVSSYLFYNCQNLAEVNIPEGVTAINSSAFGNCGSLTEIDIPEAVTQIGNYAFSGCSGLRELVLPEGVTSIGYQAFTNCSGLTEFVIPAGVTEIKFSTFEGCSGLKQIHIPEGVTLLGNNAFSGCSSLEEIYIPGTVATVEDSVFSNCTGLTKVTLAEGVTTVGNSVFSNCTGLEQVIIPDSVTMIGTYAFQNCSRLTDIQLPAQIAAISNGMFYNCSALTEMEIPAGVTGIGSYAFQNCTGLTEIYIPDNVTEIGEGTFSGCAGLTVVRLPETIAELSVSLFANCAALTSVEIPESVTVIGGSAFDSCTSLTEITIPAQVSKIGGYAFRYCGNLKQIRFTGDAPAIETYGFYNVKADASYPLSNDTWTADVRKNYGGSIRWLSYCTGEHTPVTDERVEPDCVNTGLTEGSHCAYCDVVFVAQEVIPAKGHTKGSIVVENYKDPDCTNAGGYDNVIYCTVCNVELSRQYAVLVALGHTEVIDEAVAHTCRETGLTEGKHCSVCNTVLIAQQIIPDAHDLDENGLCRVCGKYAGTCGSFAKWELDAEGTLSIYGSGSMTDSYSTTSMPWDAHKETVRKVVVEEGITGIGRSAFAGHSNLTEVTLPDSLRSISYDVFRDCTGLVRVDIPDGVTTLGGSAFYGCTNLQRVHLPENLSSVSSYLFYNCQNLTEVNIPEGVNVINSSAFGNCGSLTEIDIPEAVTQIGSSAFSGCTGLTALVLPEGVTSIGYQAFMNCSGLTEFVIPEGVTEIQFDTFNGCTGLKQIHIPEGVTLLESRAFYSCSSLEEVYVPGTVATVEDSVFGNCTGLTKVTLAEGVTTVGNSAFSGCSSLESIVIPESVTSIGSYALAWSYKLKEIHFCGDAPAMEISALSSLNATAWYPADNETWTADVMQNCGGTILWKTYCTGEHSPVVDEAVEPDCVNTGLAEGQHCAACDVILVPQEVIPANGHTEGAVMAENRVEPDCTNAGGYDNVVYCTVCEVELSREHVVLDALGHTDSEIIVENYKDPDCTHVGGYDDVAYCTVCKAELSRVHTEFAALGHTEVIDPAVEPTCRETGLTEGKHCSVCHEVLIAQQIVPDAHDLDENSLCRVCGRIAGTCGTKVKWDLDEEGTLTIYGTGAMSGSWDATEIPWYPYLESIKKAVVCEGVTSVGTSAFYNCVNLSEVLLPDSLRSIEYQAFQYCTALTEIIIPESVTSISVSAFYGCSNLTKVNIPKNITTINSYTFYNCSSLKEILIPECVTQIGSNAFAGCSALAGIEIPVAVTSIGNSAFNNCNRLAHVFYRGTEAQKNAISIENYNTSITDAEWIFETAWTTLDGAEVCWCENCSRYYHPDGTLAPLNRVEITKLPEKLRYYTSDVLDLDGIEMTGSYSNGVQVILGKDDVVSVSVNMAVPGRKNAVLTVIGIPVEFEIIVHDDGKVIIDSALYPESSHDYDNNMDESKTFTYPGAKALEITFNSLTAVENHYDNIYIYDGQDELIAQFTDTAAANQTVIVPGDTFRVRLTSDVSSTRYGYAFSKIVADFGTGIQHDVIVDPATVTCTEAGLTEGSHCGICGDILVEQEQVAALGHELTAWDILDEATCTETGLQSSECNRCGHVEQEVIPAKGHTEVIDEAVEPDCVNTGLTEGKHCSVCGETLVAQQVVPAKGHTEVIDEAVKPDCVNTGLTEGKHCSVCDEVMVEQEVIPAKGHTEVIDEAVEPDCTNTGLTEGKHCSACGEVLVEQEIVPAKGHSEVIDEAVEPDCVNTGLTEGKHCSVCDEVLVEQEIVPAKGHTEVIDEAVEPDCVNTGLTEGKHCSVCGETLVAQQVVPAKGHTEVIDEAVEPDCVNTGLTEGKHCSVCDEVLVEQEVIPAKGHTKVIDEAVEPDCVNTGLTEGKHCSVCDEVLVEQEVIPAKGHTEVVDEAVEPDCVNIGLTEGKHCSVCGETLVAQQVVPAKGHTEAIDEAVEPDCVNTGLTEGKHCSICGETLVAQQIVPAKGHTEVIDEAVEPDCTNTGLTEGKHCSVCDEVLVKQEVIPAKGHTEVIDEAVEPDCVNTGLTEGKHCSVCDEVLVEQKVIPAKGHTEVIDEAVEPDCTNTGLTEGKHCAACKAVLVKQEIVPAKGHEMKEVPASAPTFEAEGNIAHFVCEVCGKLFADAEGEAELLPEDVVLEKLTASAMVNGMPYETFSEALAAAKSGDVVQLLQDVREENVIVRKGIRVDLNGHALEAEYVFAVNGADIVDNSAGNTGLLKVAADRVMLSKTNAQLPVWNGEGYVFTTVTYKTRLMSSDSDSLKFAFLPQFKSSATKLLEDGVEGNKVTIEVRVSWMTTMGREYRNLVFNETQVDTVVGTNGAFILTFSGFSQLSMASGISVEGVVISETGVSIASTPIVVDVTGK